MTFSPFWRNVVRMLRENARWVVLSLSLWAGREYVFVIVRGKFFVYKTAFWFSAPKCVRRFLCVMDRALEVFSHVNGLHPHNFGQHCTTRPNLQSKLKIKPSSPDIFKKLSSLVSESISYGALYFHSCPF